MIVSGGKRVFTIDSLESGERRVDFTIDSLESGESQSVGGMAWHGG